MIHLDQKVKGKVTFVILKGTQLRIPSEKRQTLSHQVAKATIVYQAERGKPNKVSRFFFRSRKVAKLDDALVGKESGKKRKFYCNSKDSGSNFAALERGQTSTLVFLLREICKD